MIVSFASGAIAAARKEPLLKLDDDEAGQIAEAVANVGQHYNVPISPVTQAWVALGMTVGTIYAGKIAAIKLRKSVAEKDDKNPPNINRVLRPVPNEAAE